MKTVEKSVVYDLMLVRLGEAADEPESVDLAECRVFMEVVAEAVQRGSADNAIGLYMGGSEYSTWSRIAEMLDDLEIEAAASVFVRESVQFALDVLDLPEDGEELDFGED